MVEQVVNAVWQGFMDEELRNMTPPRFYEETRDWNLDVEDAEEAWALFHERQQAVFFNKEVVA